MGCSKQGDAKVDEDARAVNALKPVSLDDVCRYR